MIDFDQRSAWDLAKGIVLIGPGGAGKSSLGRDLAPLLKRLLIDLDIEFQRRVGDISEYIEEEGYEGYKLANSKLAGDIAVDTNEPSILVASSGFLTLDNPPLALEANQRLVADHYSVCLLPSRDLEAAVRIIVERQIARPFSRATAKEDAVIRERYPLYVRMGDLIVFSTASPGDTGNAVARRLGGIDGSQPPGMDAHRVERTR